jgi:hypothetical protein
LPVVSVVRENTMLSAVPDLLCLIFMRKQNAYKPDATRRDASFCHEA